MDKSFNPPFWNIHLDSSLPVLREYMEWERRETHAGMDLKCAYIADFASRYHMMRPTSKNICWTSKKKLYFNMDGYVP